MTPVQRQRFLLYPALICLALAALLFAACVGSVSAAGCDYTVKRGDSLYRIALTHRETLAQLMSDNSLIGSLIFPGQCLTVRGQAQTTTAQSAIPWHPPTQGPADLYSAITLAGQTFAIDFKNIRIEGDITNELFTFDHFILDSEYDPTVVLIAHNGLAGQYLYQLNMGDMIALYRNDGTVISYRVIRIDIDPNTYPESLWQTPNRLFLRTCHNYAVDDLDITAERVP